MVEGIDINPNEKFDKNCDGCTIGKQHRHPFSKRNESEANDLLEFIHSDVCGPMNIDSVGGSNVSLHLSTTIQYILPYT